MNRLTLYRGDALAGLAQLADNSVHCCVTSPPYWGLRDYGVPGQLGLEKTPEEYLENMVRVFREVRRVLRPDATLWLNMGDSYNGSGGAGEWSKRKAGKQEYAGPQGNNPNRLSHPQLKPKDLCMIPARLALALQADGWWLRADIIWHKPNPMPESCTDRPTTAHEHIFLLTKSAQYFYDTEAVREGLQSNPASWGRHSKKDPGLQVVNPRPMFGPGRNGRNGTEWGNGTSRNLRSVWTEDGRQGIIDLLELMLEYYQTEPSPEFLSNIWTLATQPFPEAHFATFPTTLPERCIKAGTSEKGCCPKCGAGWVRVVEKKPMEIKRSFNHPKPPESQTLGWRPSCRCAHTEADLLPATVLDPFSGAGTTSLVAAKMGRDAIGIELNPDYVAMSLQRLRRELGFLAQIEVIEI